MEQYLNLLEEILSGFDRDPIYRFISILKLYAGKVISFGNGGSASTASHFMVDMNKGLGIPVVCLNDNIPFITACANDIGYEYIFVKQLETIMDVGDIVVAMSVSGNSENVVKAVEYAKSRGNKTIGFTGFDGGRAGGIVDININVNVDDMQVVEDIHLILTHIIYKIIRNEDSFYIS